MNDKIDKTLKFKIRQTVLEREKRKLEIKEDDERYDIFINTILPSCLFHYIWNDQDTHMYKCPFRDCLVSTSKPHLAKKHLFHHHRNDLPTGAFNSERCNACDAGPFANKQNLKKHFRCKRHAIKSVKKGIANAEEKALYDSIVLIQNQKKKKKYHTQKQSNLKSSKANKKKNAQEENKNEQQKSLIDPVKLSEAHEPASSSSIQNIANDSFKVLENDAIMRMFNPETFGEELTLILTQEPQAQTAETSKQVYKETNRLKRKTSTKSANKSDAFDKENNHNGSNPKISKFCFNKDKSLVGESSNLIMDSEESTSILNEYEKQEFIRNTLIIKAIENEEKEIKKKL